MTSRRRRAYRQPAYPELPREQLEIMEAVSRELRHERARAAFLRWCRRIGSEA